MSTLSERSRRRGSTVTKKRESLGLCVLAAAPLLALAPVCGSPDDPENDETIHLTDVSPSTVLPGTRLELTGHGFIPGEVASATFEGRFAGRERRAEHQVVYDSPSSLVLDVEGHLFPDADGKEGSFSGVVTLRANRAGEELEAKLSTSLYFTESLLPNASEIAPEVISFQEDLTVEGEGFLLRKEGESRVFLDGYFHLDEGGSEQIELLEIPATVLSRHELRVTWSPDILGLDTGRLLGSLTIVNEHSGPGGDVEGAPLPLDLLILRPALASFDPPAARRGQALHLMGRGFLPEDADAVQGTYFTLDGVFEERDGGVLDWRGARSLDIEGAFEEPGRIRHVLRPEKDGAGGLEGFGHAPGVFRGSVTPTIRHQGRSLEGASWEGDLEVPPTLQVVYLKYVPTFTEALREFGLRNVETEVRRRIIEVCRRDYRDYNVDFRDARPTDFVDYTVIELAGRDPNDLGLFGLDNTVGLDDGNLRLDDVIGGHNAEAEEQGHFSYGGVFLESFLAFSPSLDVGHLPPEFRSTRFDHVFSYFIPELGGAPVQADEYPGGLRDQEIEEAVRVLGNVLGNTVVHEIGHALGMVSIPGQYHHDGDSPGLIMNPGQDRSFEERAELDGQGPAVWHEIDRDYLEAILPKE